MCDPMERRSTRLLVSAFARWLFRLPGLSRLRVLATVVDPLEKTLIRIGNEEYARDNRSYGLTTMRDTHARIDASVIRFVFRGKSKKEHHITLQNRRLAKIVKDCRDLPGQELFQYIDSRGKRRPAMRRDPALTNQLGHVDSAFRRRARGAEVPGALRPPGRDRVRAVTRQCFGRSAVRE